MHWSHKKDCSLIYASQSIISTELSVLVYHLEEAFYQINKPQFQKRISSLVGPIQLRTVHVDFQTDRLINSLQHF